MARIRTNKNICLYCFGDLDSDRVCTNCHHKADDTPSSPHHLPQRTVIGTQNRYLVGKALGEGGFGITYLAWDLQQGIKVALKEYFPSGYVTRVAGSNQVIINSKQNQAASNRGLKRFVEEARALAKIKNLAGVVNVRDFFSANGTAYIVMEFLDGVSLKKYLQRRGGKVSVDEVLTIMRPVMESLTQVHKIGLIHRDISPDNILITKYNEVKLIDFGAAKYSNLDGRSMSIVLKQGFAPPEQYETHGEQGPWTDVYALGVTIYYAITGTLPPESIRVMMGKEAIKRPSEMGIAIDSGVENALMKCLAVDKKKRYQDVQSMINGLYNPRAPRKTVASVTTPTAPTPKRAALPRTGAGTPITADQPQEQPSRTVKVTASRSSVTASRQSITASRKPLSNTDAQADAEEKPAATAKATAKANTEKPAAQATAKTPAEPKAASTAKATAATAKGTTPAAKSAATAKATTPAAKPAATAKATTPAAKPAATAKATTPAAKPTATAKATTPAAKPATTAKATTPAAKPATTAKATTPAAKPATTAKATTPAAKSAATAKATTPTAKPATTAKATTPAAKPAATAKATTPAAKPATTAKVTTPAEKPATTAKATTSTAKPAATAKATTPTAKTSTASAKPVETAKTEPAPTKVETPKQSTELDHTEEKPKKLGFFARLFKKQ